MRATERAISRQTTNPRSADIALHGRYTDDTLHTNLSSDELPDGAKKNARRFPARDHGPLGRLGVHREIPFPKRALHARCRSQSTEI
jgi:hypothetical protein